MLRNGQSSTVGSNIELNSNQLSSLLFLNLQSLDHSKTCQQNSRRKLTFFIFKGFPRHVHLPLPSSILFTIKTINVGLYYQSILPYQSRNKILIVFESLKILKSNLLIWIYRSSAELSSSVCPVVSLPTDTSIIWTPLYY